MSSNLIIRIEIAKLGLVKTFQFEKTDRIDQCIQSVQEKVAGTEQKPNENYGLFFNNSESQKKSVWLMNSKTLGYYYDIQNGTTLLYKDKNRLLKVKLLDETIKTVLVDDSKSVGHALDLICEKIGINTLNADEYALFIEQEKELDQIDHPDQKTSTLKRLDISKKIMERVDQHQEKKVQTLKKKAHTDDDTNWLRNDKTLREAGVLDDSVVVIRRKYTYEKSVNITNPVEINLLYVQSRDAILDGSHPCQADEAARFAGYQIHIQLGDFNEDKYKPGAVDLKEFLPKGFVKNKDVLKKIKEEHSKLQGANDLDCKYKYIQLCQNLATYGVTFFVVKEKAKGKNKLIPRLFGVSRESCFRLDEKTKQILKVWPLTTIRRWASSPTSFSLDFGDYTEGMYTSVTNEGVQICQLIGGYIDIILKRRKRIKLHPDVGDEQGVIHEGSNVPCRRVQVAKHNFQHTMDENMQYGKKASIQGELSKRQQALITNLDTNNKTVLGLMRELDDVVDRPNNQEPIYAELEPEEEEEATRIMLTNIAASVVNVVNIAADEPTDDNVQALEQGVDLMTSNLTDLTRRLKMQVVELQKDGGKDNNLLDAARELAGAFNGLLSNLHPNEKKRNGVVISMNNISRAFFKINPDGSKPNEAFQKGIMEKVNGMEKSNEELVDASKEIANSLDEASFAKINTMAENSANQMARFTSSINMLLPYINSDAVAGEVSDAIRQLTRDTNALGGLCMVACDEDELKDKIQTALVKVIGSSGELLKYIQKGSEKFVEDTVYDQLLDATDEFFKNLGDTEEMIKQSIVVGQVCAQLAKKMESMADDSQDKDALLKAVNKLAQATAKLLTAAKALKSDPDNREKQEKLKELVIDLRDVVNDVTNDSIKTARIAKLRDTAMEVLKSTTVMINAAKTASAHNTDPISAQNFTQTSTAFITVGAKGLSDAVKGIQAKPDSPQAKRKLILSSKYFIPAASRMIDSSRQMIPHITKNTAALHLSKTILQAEKISQEFQDSTESAFDGKEEYDQTLNAINRAINDIDRASLNAISSSLPVNRSDSIKNLKDKIEEVCDEVDGCIPSLLANAKTCPEKIGSAILKLHNAIGKLTPVAISFASTANMALVPRKQIEMLDKTKTVLESALMFINAAKNSGGDPEATDFHDDMDEAADNFKVALNELEDFTKGSADEIEGISVSMKTLQQQRLGLLKPVETTSLEKLEPYVVYQGKIVKSLKLISQDSHDLVAKSHTKPHELTNVCNKLSTTYGQLCEDIKCAAQVVSPEVGNELLSNTEDLGDACHKIMESSSKFQINRNDADKKSLSENAKDVSIKVAQLMSNVQKSGTGTQECINAVSALEAMICDLDTTAMFAQAATLEKDDDTSFQQHREKVLISIQSVGKGTKVVVRAANGTQNQLAMSVKDITSQTSHLVHGIKIAAASLGTDDINGQVLLLNAAKDVASALSDLINSTQNASGKPATDPTQNKLKSAAKHMVGNLASLLKTVKSVEDEASRGVRAVESTIDAIRQAVIVKIPGDDAVVKKSTPDDLVRAAKGVTLATAKAVAASNSGKQAELIQVANAGRKVCLELYEVAEGVVHDASHEEIRNAIVAHTNESNEWYCQVLDTVLKSYKDPQLKTDLAELSKKCATAIGVLVKSAEELKGNDHVHPEDPHAKAENELLGAAASIEAAARKLAQLKPKAKPKDADEDLNFEEQILEAAKAITSATATLVKSASDVQKELMDTGMVSLGADNYADTQWSMGLISAARLVAVATESLCESANAAVLGNASQDKLIASAQAVSSSTAQLLLASQVKANPYSKRQKGLMQAGTAVKLASEALVKAAEEASVFEVDDVELMRNNKGEKKTNEIIQQIEAQEEILKKERELNLARRRLELLREAKYAREKEEEENKENQENRQEESEENHEENQLEKPAFVPYSITLKIDGEGSTSF